MVIRGRRSQKGPSDHPWSGVLLEINGLLYNAKHPNYLSHVTTGLFKYTCLPEKEPENAVAQGKDNLYGVAPFSHTNNPCFRHLHFVVLLLVSKYSLANLNLRFH
jgi:hypothetical protein